MKRHKNLMLRKLENTSLFRATAFNETNIMEFFNNYEPTLKSWEFTADRVYNINETGVSTFIQSPNIVAQFGTKLVGKDVSGEREAMLTLCMIIYFFGYTVSPVSIFPRAILHDSLMFGAPP
jgi:hypothetical protein